MSSTKKILTIKDESILFVPEIERKFFVKKLPPHLSDYPHQDILQGYYKDNGITKRIRKKGNIYEFTIKIGKGILKQEGQKKISKKMFDKLRTLVGKNFIKKIRYKIPYNNYIIELDIYKDFPGLITAEVEFPNKHEAYKFIPPSRFGQELTNIKEAKNSYLAQYGISKPLLKIIQQSKKSTYFI